MQAIMGSSSCSNNAPAAGSDAAGNAKEAQEWIDAWMKNK
jgi:hypothetical protein